MKKSPSAVGRVQAIKPIRSANSVWAVQRTKLYQRQLERNELQDGKQERAYLAQSRSAGRPHRKPL